MDKLLTYLKKIKQEFTIENIMVKVVGKDRRLMTLIVSLNTQDQLFNKGIRSDGSDITPPYSAYTISLKQAKGQPTDRVTLKDTGEFYDSFVAFVDGSKDIIIDSNPIKVDEQGFETNLLEKYGERVEGLTLENQAIINEKILLPVQKYVENVIFKA